MSHKLLIPKGCPVCDKIIYVLNEQGKAVKLNEYGIEFWVKWNDGKKGKFSICKDCFPALTKEQIDKLNDDQIYTWGQEIQSQIKALMSWYTNTAVFVKIEKWAGEESGL